MLNHRAEGYGYTVFGLNVDSEIEFPELIPANFEKADVVVRFGSIVDDRVAALAPNGEEFILANGGMAIFRFKDIALFQVEKGSKITIEPCSPVDMTKVKAFFLGFAMNILLRQRGSLVMHASVIAISGAGILLVGLSGAGKSTLTAALCKRGWSFLSDDIGAIIGDHNGVLRVHPAFPEQRLSPDSAAALGIATAGLRKVFDKDKFAVPMNDVFQNEPVAVRAVYELSVGDEEAVAVTPLTGIAKLKVLIDNTYGARFLNFTEKETENLQQCTALGKQAVVYRLTRPNNAKSLESLADIFTQHSQKHIGHSLPNMGG